MSFLAPFYLLLGAAAAVPLLLHLLRRNIVERVEFPAARYLQRAELEHSRSMRIRNLLLMLLRVLLILAIALAAARPFLPGLGAGHGPTALAVVLDNSLSTTVVTDGAPLFNKLRDAARLALSSGTSADRMWLVTADGQVRGGSREALLAELDRVVPSEDAGDLALALRRAAAAVQGSALPSRGLAVATDAQRTAWRGAARVSLPLALYTPGGDPPRNRGVVSLAPEPARWTPRGVVTAQIDAPDSAGWRLLIGGRTLARGAAARGEPVQLHVAPPERGWQTLRIELEPDDFPADDARSAAVYIGAPPAVTADASAGSFASTALGTLVTDGRATRGGDVRISSADAASSLPALLLPPADAVRLGAANRELARLGVPWRFGEVQRSPAIVRGNRLDGVDATLRYRLVREGAGDSDTLATAAGEPWLVAGPGYVLLASPLDPAATSLPIRAPFVPWLADMLSLRLGAARGDEGAPLLVRPGASVRIPSGVDALETPEGSRRAVREGPMRAPDERGVWFMLRGGSRIGAIVVSAPAEESALARETPNALAARLAGTRGTAERSASAWAGAAFAAGSRRPALTPLLVLALLLLAAEAVAVRTTRSNAA